MSTLSRRLDRLEARREQRAADQAAQQRAAALAVVQRPDYRYMSSADEQAVVSAVGLQLLEAAHASNEQITAARLDAILTAADSDDRQIMVGALRFHYDAQAATQNNAAPEDDERVPCC